MADKKLEENINSEGNNINTTIDENLKEILNKLSKKDTLSKEDIEKLKKESLESINFVEKINEINLDFDKYVIFTDGDTQLIYEDGEFYVVSSTDSTKEKEKKKKEEAKNMYLEYFIRYVLNPIIKQRDVESHAKVKSLAREKETRELRQKISEKAKVKKEKEVVQKQALEVEEVKDVSSRKARKREEKSLEIDDR